MIKKLLGLFIFLALCSSSFAAETKDLPYKNIKEGQKINITEQGWTDKVKRKDISGYTYSGNELISSNAAYDTGCNYLFINKERLFGYSEKDLKFYELSLQNENLSKTELKPEELSVLFEDFKIILTSEFSKTTNVYKMKKNRGEEKIMIISDTEGDFSDYIFTSNKARFNKYSINNVLGVTKGGLIQFSKYGENTRDLPWFILLVR